jgi:hypothetical protein
MQSYILNSIPVECSIGIGHSITLQKMNITRWSLIERGNIVYDKELSINREERKVLPTEFS